APVLVATVLISIQASSSFAGQGRSYLFIAPGLNFRTNEGYYGGDRPTFYWTTDLVWMRNVRNGVSAGMGGFVGGGQEFYRGGIKARIRARFPGKTYLDIAPGVIFVIHDDANDRTWPGFVGELSAGVEGLGGLAFQMEKMKLEDIPDAYA